MIKKYITVFSALSLILNSLFAQTENSSFIPMSPNAAALAMYADYPVSHYTGVPNISIPLYEIEVDGFKLPISLSYHSKGVGLSQEASWVGLGWALNAGGAISRSIKCEDDFSGYSRMSHSNSHYGWYEDASPLDLRKDQPDTGLGKIMWGYTLYGQDPVFPSKYICHNNFGEFLLIDTEPDIFYYSLPHLSGKFIYDKTPKPVFFNKEHNLKIEVFNSSIIVVNGKPYGSGFKVTDADGVIYIFTCTEKIAGSPGEYRESTYNNVTTSWLLSNIITRNGKEIKFTYSHEITRSPEFLSYESASIIYSGTSDLSNYDCTPNGFGQAQYSVTEYNSYRLSKIEWENGYIDFSANNIREDLRSCYNCSNGFKPKRLDKISIYTNEGLLKSFDFQYDYFNNSTTGAAYLYKRLKLNNVTEKDKNNKPLNHGYSFEYFAGNMPAKNSGSKDYWGYMNSVSNQDIELLGTKKIKIASCINGKFYCASQTLEHLHGHYPMSVFNVLKTGTLSKMYLPTGENTVFEYEENKYQYNEFYKTLTKSINPYSQTLGLPQLYDNSIQVANKYQNRDLLGYPLTYSDTIVITEPSYFRIVGNIQAFTAMLSDPDFEYESVANPIAQLRKLGGGIIGRIPMPRVNYDIDLPYDEEDDDKYMYELSPGTYIFDALDLPKDYYGYWYVGVFRNSSSVSPKGGGLRIRKITTGNKVRSFEYFGGKMLVQPPLIRFMEGECEFRDPRTNKYWKPLLQVQSTEVSRSFNTLKDGNAIGYSTVYETVTDGMDISATESNFYNKEEVEEINPDNAYNMDMYTRIDFKNGLLLNKKLYKTNALVQETQYEYTEADEASIVCYKASDNNLHRGTRYQYDIKNITKREEKTINYLNGGSVLQTTTFDYNPRLQLKSTNTKNSENSVNTSTTLYPVDCSSIPQAQDMLSKNMLNLPMEQITTKDNMVISAKKTDYILSNGNYVPSTMYQLQSSTPLALNSYSTYYKPVLYYEHYNAQGKVQQLRTLNQTSVYLWSYKSEYPVAEIKNATYGQVETILTANFIANLSNATEPTAADMTALNGLRAALPNAMISTYTYKPLVGMVSATDPRGITTTYTYDEFQRLKDILDYNGKLLKNMNYHYKE